jgi:hypothetical protein
VTDQLGDPMAIVIPALLAAVVTGLLVYLGIVALTITWRRSPGFKSNRHEVTAAGWALVEGASLELGCWHSITVEVDGEWRAVRLYLDSPVAQWERPV